MSTLIRTSSQILTFMQFADVGIISKLFTKVLKHKFNSTKRNSEEMEVNRYTTDMLKAHSFS